MINAYCVLKYDDFGLLCDCMCNVVFLFGSIDERVDATFPEEIRSQGSRDQASEHGELGWSEPDCTVAATQSSSRAVLGQGASASYTRK